MGLIFPSKVRQCVMPGVSVNFFNWLAMTTIKAIWRAKRGSLEATLTVSAFSENPSLASPSSEANSQDGERKCDQRHKTQINCDRRHKTYSREGLFSYGNAVDRGTLTILSSCIGTNVACAPAGRTRVSLHVHRHE